MPGDEKTRIRLKLPSGLELEAEGQPEFVRAQIRELLGMTQGPAPKAGPAADPETALEPALDAILEQKGPHLTLRSLAGNLQDACLLLLLGSEKILHLPKPTAAQLARWLRNSGHKIDRVDRILAEPVQNGQVLASGARRSRRYELSNKGRLRALLALEKQAQKSSI